MLSCILLQGTGGRTMYFNSFIFVLLFLPITVVIYHLINHKGHYTAAKLFLLAMSLWFYCYEDPENVIVLLVSIVLNYLIATKLLAPKGSGHKLSGEAGAAKDSVPGKTDASEGSDPGEAGLSKGSVPEGQTAPSSAGSLRKFFLAVGILLNISALLYFKYLGFFPS